MSAPVDPRVATWRPRPVVVSNLFFLALRRMRTPLVLVVVIYAVCVMGLSLVPGVDADGARTHGMGLFNAFYVVSFTGTTIGLGELPDEFSAGQRMWMIVTIYLTVSGWTYTIMRMISLLGERGFQQAIRDNAFARHVLSLREPFYIVCGSGETGTLVCHGLDRLRYRVVVIDTDPERIQELRMEAFFADVPAVTADATLPATLISAGLESPYCRGVMALAANDDTNRAIAVNVRLLAPDVPILARVGNPSLDTNFGPFGGEVVINPFERFANHLVAAVSAPLSYRLREILTALTGEPLPERHHPPRGHWIMCGYGRFGQTIRHRLESAGMTVTVIDHLHFGEPGVDVDGTGTDAVSLRAAGVETSQGIVAGNANDQKNLAIAIAARELNPDIFVVTRQNQTSNSALFEAFEHDLAMVPSRIVAREFLALITTPLLARFLEIIPEQGEQWCAELTKKLERLNHHRVPDVWSLTINEQDADAIVQTLMAGEEVTLKNLCTNPRDRSHTSRSLILLLARDGEIVVLPDENTPLAVGDEILLVGSQLGHPLVTVVAKNSNALDYVRLGTQGSGSWIWRRHWLRKRRTDAAVEAEAGKAPEAEVGKAPTADDAETAEATGEPEAAEAPRAGADVENRR